MKLTLRTEHLAELSPDDLASVNGADAPLPTQYCTGAYPTIVCAPIIAAVTRIVTTTTG